MRCIYLLTICAYGTGAECRDERQERGKQNDKSAECEAGVAHNPRDAHEQNDAEYVEYATDEDALDPAEFDHIAAFLASWRDV